MALPFFKVKLVSLKASEKEIIGKLIHFRLSGYQSSAINHLTNETMEQIRELAIKFGEQILEVNCPSSVSYSQAKINFNQIIKKLPPIKFIIGSYTAQLIQFYTITSSDKFIPEQSSNEFNDFLMANIKEFGSTHQNLFIAEYKLIKIYNDLCDFVDAHEGVLALIPQQKEQLDYINTELNQLHGQIKNWLAGDPCNVFTHYLNFASHYCYAKKFELFFKINQHTLTDDEKEDLAFEQNFHLQLAHNSLDEYEALISDPDQVYSGAEFSLGRNVLEKLPTSSLDEIKSHVASLRT